MNVFSGEIYAGGFYFDDNNATHPALKGRVGFGPGGQGNDAMYLPLAQKDQVALGMGELKEGRATLEIKNSDPRGLIINSDYIIKNSDS